MILFIFSILVFGFLLDFRNPESFFPNEKIQPCFNFASRGVSWETLIQRLQFDRDHT